MLMNSEQKLHTFMVWWERGGVTKRKREGARSLNRCPESPFWLAGWMASLGRRRKGGREESEGKQTWEQSWWRHILNRFTLIHFWCLAFRAAKLTLTSPHRSHSSLLSFSLPSSPSSSNSLLLHVWNAAECWAFASTSEEARREQDSEPFFCRKWVMNALNALWAINGARWRSEVGLCSEEVKWRGSCRGGNKENFKWQGWEFLMNSGALAKSSDKRFSFRQFGKD